MHKVWRVAVAVGSVTLLAGSTAAAADPDGHDPAGEPRESFPREGVAEGRQHDGEDGHLPPRQENVTLVGKAGVTVPSGGAVEGRVADVWAHGDHAYLNAFSEPDCTDGGVHVMDISDLSAPAEVQDAFIPTSAGSYAGEGVQVVPMDNEHFRGDLLVHQNETCDPEAVPEPQLRGGASLWDVTDPTSPEPVALHVGDVDPETVGPAPNDAHSVHAWTDGITNRTYMVLVDNFDARDVDIMDITNPHDPVMVNNQLDLDELFDVSQDQPDNLTSVFSHDFFVKRVGERYVLAVAYWDGGYVLLDVTDPTEGNVSLLADSDFASLDEERLQRGQEIAPEGNAHYMELSPDDRFLLASDEDFQPYRGFAVIESGPYEGTEYATTGAAGTPPITETVTLEGPTSFVGLACEPLEAGEGTALIERGDCSFQDKLDAVVAAGYSGGIVFNSAEPNCDARITMSVSGEHPAVFVDRVTGLQLLGLEIQDDPCAQAAPEPGSPSEATSVRGEFAGWGYVRLFEQDLDQSVIPGQPATEVVPCLPLAPECSEGSLTQLDTYAIDEAQDQNYASGFGDLSVHKAIVDPHQQGLAYVAYYSGGLRVVTYGADGIDEVGVFIDEEGNNFWGANVYRRDDETYVLAADRDYGLYVLQYTP